MPINWDSMTTDRYGNVEVAIQDQHTQFIDFRLALNLGSTLVSVSNLIEDRSIEVVNASSASVGDTVIINRGTTGTTTQIFQGTIQAIASNVITVDTPLNYAFQVGDSVLFRDQKIELADGSLVPIIYDIYLPSGTIYLDITRFIFCIVCSTEPDDSKFGDLAALTNGCVLRHNSVTYGIRNVWNFKTNGDMAALSYDVVYSDKAGGGSFGVRAMLSLSGAHNHGVTIRMEPGDKMEIVIQDDLTDLQHFEVVVQGHVVD